MDFWSNGSWSFELLIDYYLLIIFKITNHKSQITNYKLQITNYKLQITNYKLQITNNFQIPMRPNDQKQPLL